MNKITRTGLLLFGIEGVILLVFLVGYILTSITWTTKSVIIIGLGLYNIAALAIFLYGVLTPEKDIKTCERRYY